MNEFTGLLPVIKEIGFPALIFAIWYFYHKDATKQLTDIINQNFKLLSDMFETNLLQNAKLQVIESKIDNNSWCPIYRKYKKAGEMQNDKSLHS